MSRTLAQVGDALLGAHTAGDAPALIGLYAEAAALAEAAGALDAACFYWTHAHVYALETGDPRAAALRAVLKRHGREE